MSLSEVEAMRQVLLIMKDAAHRGLAVLSQVESSSSSKTARTKVNKKRPERDPSMPRRAKSAWMCYMMEQRPLVIAENKEFTPSTIGPVTKIIGAAWSAMTPEEREPYVTMAEEDSKRYEREYGEWVASMPVGSRPPAKKAKTSKTKSEPTMQQITNSAVRDAASLVAQAAAVASSMAAAQEPAAVVSPPPVPEPPVVTDVVKKKRGRKSAK